MECKYNGSDRRLDYLFDNANHVEVDPIQTAGDPVADITIDGETTRLYAPAGGGGGTTVVANPPESATDELEKIQIGSVVYDIPAGGGGGGSVMMSDYYSTDERVVGRWIDGKPIYQRVIDFNKTGSVSDWTLLDDSISYDKLIFASSFAVASNASNDQTISFQDRDAIPRFAVRNDHKLYYYIQNFTNIQSAKVIIKYTKTTDAAGTGPTPGNLIYLPTLYSEEEREVGVWTDGKPLYQKTVIWNNIQLGRVDNLAHNIANVDHIHLTNWIFNDYVTGHETSDQTYWAQIFAISPTYISYRIGNGWSGGNNVLRVTLQYTKTTDQPGSGTYLPDGSYSHHYSSTEQIVGTWIDGSTVYEKVITLNANLVTNNTSWSYVSYSNQLTNIDRLISCAPLDSTDSYLIGRFCVDNHKLAAASVNSGTLLESGQMLIIRYTKTT